MPGWFNAVKCYSQDGGWHSSDCTRKRHLGKGASERLCDGVGSMVSLSHVCQEARRASEEDFDRQKEQQEQNHMGAG